MKTYFTTDIRHFGKEVAEDWDAGRPDKRLEARVGRIARARSLTAVAEPLGTPARKVDGNRCRGRVALVARGLGLGAPETAVTAITELGGFPADIEEAARWSGWCRVLQDRFLTPHGPSLELGPNGGVSGHSRATDWLELKTAKRFGFVPARILAAAETAIAECRRLKFTPRWWFRPWSKVLSPSRRRTRRNVRRLYLLDIHQRVDAMLEGRPRL